jgi:anionic cell wall polymer biosynthesis LytR-Cps2A-Psr (LCP) family protein
MMSDGGQRDIAGGRASEDNSRPLVAGPGATSNGNGVASTAGDAAAGLSGESRSVLYKRARSMGIAHTVSMTREELIAAIEAASDIPAHIEPADGVAVDAENGRVDVAQNGHAVVEEEAEEVAPKRPRRRRAQPAEVDAVADFDAARAIAPPVVPPKETVVEPPAEEHAPPAEVREEPETDSRLGGAPPSADRPRTLSVWGAVRRQRFLSIVLGVLTLLVAGLSWAWLSYHKLTNDLQTSNNRVPAGVRQVLAPQGAISSTPTTILFEGVNLQEQPRGSVLLLHTNPSSHVLSTLALPPSTVVPGAEKLQTALATARTQGSITLLNHVAGISVGHVVLVNLAELAHAVDLLGGLPIDNPVAVHYSIPHGGSGTILAGHVTLTGPLTALYLRPRAPTPGLDSVTRQNIVLKALIEKMLRPTSLSGVEALGRVLATTVATDLSASNVLDLASVRLGADRFVSCSAPPRSEFGRGELKAALAEFEAPPSVGGPSTTACTWRPIVAAPGGLVGSVSQQAVQNLPSILLTLLASSVTLWILAAVMMFVMVRRTLRAARMPAPAFAVAGAPSVSEYRSAVPERAVEPAQEPAVHAEQPEPKPAPEAAVPPVIDFGDQVEFEPPAAELLAAAEVEPLVETPPAPVGEHQVEPVAEAIPGAEPESPPSGSRRWRPWGRDAAPQAAAVEAMEPVVEPEPVLEPQPLPKPRKERRQRTQPRLPRIVLPSLTRPNPQPSRSAASGAHRQGAASGSRANPQRSLPSSMSGMVIPALLGAAGVGLVFYVALTVLAR